MANTVEGSGTQVATPSTEHSLHTNAGAKTFVLLVDINALASGEGLELRVKGKVLSGGTIRQWIIGSYNGDTKINNLVSSIPFVAPGHTGGTEFTLKQIGGTGRSFPWSVVSIG